MNAQTQTIREQARQLLESGDVQVIVGFGEASTQARTTPVFVRTSDEVDQLVWSASCADNLALYVRDLARTERVAVVAKSCDAAAIAVLIQEKQIEREQVYILGVPCRGVIDAGRLRKSGVDEEDIVSIDASGDTIAIETSEQTLNVPASHALKEACLACERSAPPIYDVLIGEEVKARATAELTLPEKAEDRRKFWAQAFEACIRCYACRQVCPLCYCTTCFADCAVPKWLSKKIQADENWMYHTTRAMHLAGRCAACGECERACPMGLPVSLLMREMARDVEELFDYRAGAATDEPTPLGTFRDDDEGPEG
ncbi:MAG: 4Fe-4S dicluster domain-containing protein [Armatimonadetes bacterium]|nr:4Fe-4S dicluster domain-containing protein [Armatimonadota bacterium]